jgi:hypothetical protein
MRAACKFLALVLLLAGCGGGSGAPEGATAEVVLEAANGSGITGTASVTRVAPATTRVVVRVDGLPGRQTSALVAGECGGFTAPTVERKLNDVVNGKATTDVPLSFDEMTGSGFTIAVRRAKEYVTCGPVVP